MLSGPLASVAHYLICNSIRKAAIIWLGEKYQHASMHVSFVSVYEDADFDYQPVNQSIGGQRDHADASSSERILPSTLWEEKAVKISEAITESAVISGSVTKFLITTFQ